MNSLTHQTHKRTIIRLDQGEPVVTSLERIAESKNITSGTITGIGAVEDAVIGYYQRKQKKYRKDTFKQPYELTNLTGFVTQDDGNVHVHAHVTLAGEGHQAFGGHLHEATVAAAGEFWVDHGNKTVKRQYNGDLGLKLMKFSS